MTRHIAKNSAAAMALRDERGNSPAHVAAKHGSLEALKLLALHEPALLRAQNGVRNEPAHVAAEAGQVEILRWLCSQARCPSPKDT